MEYFKKGESIESNGSQVIAKFIDDEMPRKHPQLGLSVKYSCERDGEAIITRELNPKKAIVRNESALNKGDKIRASEFICIVQNPKSIKPKKLKGKKFSGRHNAQTFQTKDKTFAQIKKPFTHIINALEKKKAIKR